MNTEIIDGPSANVLATRNKGDEANGIDSKDYLQGPGDSPRTVRMFWRAIRSSLSYRMIRNREIGQEYEGVLARHAAKHKPL